MEEVSGIFTIFRIFLKKLVKAIFRAICGFLTKKRYMGNHPRVKKAIMLTFLSINAIAWIVVPNYILLNGPKEIIIIEAKDSVGDAVDTSNEATTQDTLNGDVEQQASSEVAPLTVEDKICDVFGEDCELATAIFKAESGLKENAIGYNCYYNGKSMSCKQDDRGNAWSVDCGVAQINVKGKVCPTELLNADTNLKKAKEMHDNRGFQPWYAFTNQVYIKFLNS